MRKNIIKLIAVLTLSTIALSVNSKSVKGEWVYNPDTGSDVWVDLSDWNNPDLLFDQNGNPVRPSIIGVEINEPHAVYFGHQDFAWTYIFTDDSYGSVVLPTSYEYNNFSYPITEAALSDGANVSEIIVPDCYEDFDFYSVKNTLKKVVFENDNTVIRSLERLQEAQVYVERKGHDEVTVTYLNQDGSIRALEVVDRGSSAEYSNWEEKPFFTLVGWEGADLSCVTEDVVVSPVYELTKTETAGKLTLANDNVIYKESPYASHYKINPQFENVTGEYDYSVIITSSKGMKVTYTRAALERKDLFGVRNAEIEFPLLKDVYDLHVIATDDSEAVFEKHIEFTPEYRRVDETHLTIGWEWKPLSDYYIPSYDSEMVIGDRLYFSAFFDGQIEERSAEAYNSRGYSFYPSWDEEKQLHYFEFSEEQSYYIRIGHGGAIIAQVNVTDPNKVESEEILWDDSWGQRPMDWNSDWVKNENGSWVPPTETPDEEVIEEPTETPNEVEDPTEEVEEVKETPDVEDREEPTEGEIEEGTETPDEVEESTPTGDPSRVLILASAMALALVSLKKSISK